MEKGQAIHGRKLCTILGALQQMPSAFTANAAKIGRIHALPLLQELPYSTFFVGSQDPQLSTFQKPLATFRLTENPAYQ